MAVGLGRSRPILALFIWNRFDKTALRSKTFRVTDHPKFCKSFQPKKSTNLEFLSRIHMYL
jgi:hypothetical protein